MQIATDVVTHAVSSITQRAHSLRHFGRTGALLFGIASGTIAAGGATAARESSYKAILAERDAEIAKLKSVNKTLEMEKDGKTEKASSGDAIQDWVDSLEE